MQTNSDKKINVLLVDDRPEGLMALEAVLAKPNYNLVKAESGEQALAKVLAEAVRVQKFP